MNPKALLTMILASPADDLLMTLGGSAIPSPEIAGVSVTTLLGVSFGVFMTAKLARKKLTDDEDA